MKKITYFLLIGILVFSTCSCTKKEEKKENKKTVATSEEIKVQPKYVDDNNIMIGLYTRDASGYHFIENEIHIPWYQYKDIIVFKTLPTHDSIINNWYMQDAFPSYWNTYENNKTYKIGYNLSYETDNGSFSWNIINPEDRMYDVFNYVQLYTYDDVTPAKGSWYDHLDNNEITDGILMTSIKLTGSTYINTIHSPMKLTVFTYNGSDDFDPETGNYRGNSFHTINIYRTN